MLNVFICWSLILASPLNLDWNMAYKPFRIPQIEGYRYYLGDVKWGEVTYTRAEDLLGMEAEVQLKFRKNKISKLTLILGPAGLNDYNCLEKYKQIRTFLARKYGKKSFVLDVKDPIIKDLLRTSACKPIILGIRTIKTTWVTKKYIIEASLLGDSEGYYIEIEYRHIKRTKTKSYSKEKIFKNF